MVLVHVAFVIFVGIYFVASFKKLKIKSAWMFLDMIKIGEAYVMRSLRSFSFFRPPKAILVPGIYFLGFSR